MKFIKLEMLNLASLDRPEGEVINFEEGALGNSTIFSIVGPTGSGKSTILDAICLALYKRAPRYPRKKGDRNQGIVIFGEPDEGERNRLCPTDSRNILTRGKKKGYSKLTFLANNGEVYRAEWHVAKARTNYQEPITALYKIARKDGRQVEEAVEWETLPTIIGLDYEQFLRTVLIAQGSFSSFIKAKEEERANLLERLIGCEELYSSISAAIKEKRSKAAEAFNDISAQFSAQEKDLISDEELPEFLARISQLESVEKQAKDELEKVKAALNWYTVDEKYIESIAEFEQSFMAAKQAVENNREMESRLNLHDVTLEAVTLYRDAKAAESLISTLGESLNKLADSIAAKNQDIAKETDENLARLNQKAHEALTELNRQRPHIAKAREIKVELANLKKSAEEKNTAKNLAETAKKTADENLSENAGKIENYLNNWLTCTKEFDKMVGQIAETHNLKKDGADKAREKFDEKNRFFQELDATKLQETKDDADKMLSDLNDAIRIQENLKTRRTDKEKKTAEHTKLSACNQAIEKELGTLNVEKLRKELDTLNKSYTLMTSENFEQHRADLKDGDPCPLCGATHHPYHDGTTVAHVIDEMEQLIEEKRGIIETQSSKEQSLIKEKAENDGMIKGIREELGNIQEAIAQLDKEWDDIHSAHEKWGADVETLMSLKPTVEQDAKDATKALKDYNDLMKLVDQLRQTKEKAEKELRDFEKSAQKQKEEAQQKLNTSSTVIEAEKAKTENLKIQKKEKEAALKEADDALAKVNKEISQKEESLRAEIGDNNPDEFEKQLEEVKTNAEKAVADKKEAISRLREKLTELTGQEKALKIQKREQEQIMAEKNAELIAWIEKYNSGKHEAISEDTIARLSSADDDWEKMREQLKELAERYTSSETTLNNEKKAREDHQEGKPEKQKEELKAKKAELESISNDELINAKARHQRHEAAKQEMGAMYEKRQEAEQNKIDWEEIYKSIGTDGKILRNIAQCYTLRFLIEHANAEIRKFNNRYELVQVKNSLGIRVIDHDRADDIRDTTSLSGGETFIVSLGLALGLSSLSSRNISFGNLFIDEGFGTLDPDTLDTVLDSLSMLQSSQGKKVGVISHTDTMREQIPTQIRVIKEGNSGSSHIEIYPY